MEPKTKVKKLKGIKSVREQIQPEVAPHDVMGTFTENLSYINDVAINN